MPLPDVPGFTDDPDHGLLGVVISHGHPDHYGLVNQLGDDVPIYMGEATSKILSEAAFFSAQGQSIKTSRIPR